LRVAALASWWRSPSFMAAQATVIEVHDTWWQTTVECLSHHVGAILIDVSIITDNLAWEIGRLANAKRACLYIGERRHIAVWNEDIAQGTLAGTFNLLLQNQTVLVYYVTRRGEKRHLRRELTKMLDNNPNNTDHGAITRTYRERISALANWTLTYALTI